MTSIWSGVLWLFGVLTGSIQQDVTFNGKLSSGRLTCTGILSTGTNAVKSTGDLLADGGLNIAGAATIGGATTLKGDLNVQGANLDASVVTQAFMPATTFYGGVNFGASGRVAPKVKRMAGVVGMSVSPTVANHWQLTTAASGSTITIDDTGAIDGDWVEITNNSATNSISINGGALGILKNASGFTRTTKLVRDGGAWFVFYAIGA